MWGDRGLRAEIGRAQGAGGQEARRDRGEGGELCRQISVCEKVSGVDVVLVGEEVGKDTRKGTGWRTSPPALSSR